MRSSQVPQHGFLDIPRAAAWCSVSPKTITRWIRAGLPSYQASPRTKVLIRPQDLEGFLTRRQQPRPAIDKLVEETLAELLTEKNPR